VRDRSAIGPSTYGRRQFLGAADAAAGDGAACRSKFSPYEHQTLPVGHNVPQEAPNAFANAVTSVDSFTRR
jgi:hypothetical protein